MGREETFHERLKRLIHEYIMETYRATKAYPSDERFGLVSQDRRASVSVMLNYVEGYARMKQKVMINFFETSFASLKESIYCRYLAKELGFITGEEYKKAYLLKEEIARMLYSSINKMKKG